MTTDRRWTLDEIRAACKVAGLWPATIAGLEARLLAAKPEAKTCEPSTVGLAPGWYDWGGQGPCELCRRGRPGSDGAVYEFRKHGDATKQTYVCHYCAERMGAFNPAPAASPPAWCECSDYASSGVPCPPGTCPTARDRAKAVPRDAAQRWKAGDRIRLSNGTEAKWDGITRTQESLEREGWSAVASGGQPGVPDGWRVVGKSSRAAPLPAVTTTVRYTRHRDGTVLSSPWMRQWGDFVSMPVVDWEAGCFDIMERVPAEPSRPVTGESSDVIECKTGNFPYRWMRFIGEVQQGSNDKVTWVQTRPAPGNHPGTGEFAWKAFEDDAGKPDEAPLASPDWTIANRTIAELSGKLADVTWGHGIWRDKAFAYEKERDDLRAQLATRDAEVDELVGIASAMEARANKAEEEREDIRRQVAARDARIAGLEASYADDKAAAVLEERARCLAVVDDAIAKGYVGLAARATIASGAPAPTGVTGDNGRKQR